jgi:hypothetical protein
MSELERLDRFIKNWRRWNVLILPFAPLVANLMVQVMIRATMDPKSGQAGHVQSLGFAAIDALLTAVGIWRRRSAIATLAVFEARRRQIGEQCRN